MHSWGWITRFDTACREGCAHFVLNSTSLQPKFGFYTTLVGVGVSQPELIRVPLSSL